MLTDQCPTAPGREQVTPVLLRIIIFLILISREPARIIWSEYYNNWLPAGCRCWLIISGGRKWNNLICQGTPLWLPVKLVSRRRSNNFNCLWSLSLLFPNNPSEEPRYLCLCCLRAMLRVLMTCYLLIPRNATEHNGTRTRLARAAAWAVKVTSELSYLLFVNGWGCRVSCPAKLHRSEGQSQMQTCSSHLYSLLVESAALIILNNPSYHLTKSH